MLTTIDNPWDPFTQFDDWYAFDQQKRYFTCELLARIAKIPENFELFDENFDENSSLTQAIDDIIKLNPLGIYKKVYKN